MSSLVGPEYYVNIMSFVDKGQLEPGCSILLHNKVSAPAFCPDMPRLCRMLLQCEGMPKLGGSNAAGVLQVLSVVGILQDEADPMVSVMKVRSPNQPVQDPLYISQHGSWRDCCSHPAAALPM